MKFRTYEEIPEGRQRVKVQKKFEPHLCSYARYLELSRKSNIMKGIDQTIGDLLAKDGIEKYSRPAIVAIAHIITQLILLDLFHIFLSGKGRKNYDSQMNRAKNKVVCEASSWYIKKTGKRGQNNELMRKKAEDFLNLALEQLFPEPHEATLNLEIRDAVNA
jgi:hypothetical protein